MYKPDLQAYLQGFQVSRTTTVDGAPASDTESKAFLSQINLLNAVRRNLCGHPGAVLCRTGNICTSLLCAPILPVLSQEFGLTPANSSISCPFPRRCWLLVCCLLARYPSHWSQTSDGHGATVGLHLYVLSTMMTSWHGILIMRALIGLR